MVCFLSKETHAYYWTLSLGLKGLLFPVWVFRKWILLSNQNISAETPHVPPEIGFVLWGISHLWWWWASIWPPPYQGDCAKRILLWWGNMQSYRSKSYKPAASLFGSRSQFLQNRKAVTQNDAWSLIHWSVQAWGLVWDKAVVSGGWKFMEQKRCQDMKTSQIESVADCQNVQQLVYNLLLCQTLLMYYLM